MATFSNTPLDPSSTPSASAVPTVVAGAPSHASTPNSLETLTIPIVFGIMGAILTLATIVIGIVQIKAMKSRHRDLEYNNDIELDAAPPVVSNTSTTPQS